MAPRGATAILAALCGANLADAILRVCPDSRSGPTEAQFGAGNVTVDPFTGTPISGFATPVGGVVSENTVVLTTCDFMYPNISYADSGVPCGEPNAPASDEASCEAANEISFFSEKYSVAEIALLRDEINTPILNRGIKVSQALLDNSLPGVVDLTAETTVNVTFLTEGACRENALGMFTFWTADFPPTEDWVRGDGNRARMLDTMNVSIIFPTVDDIYCNRLDGPECNLSDENQEFCTATNPNLMPGTTVRLKPDFRADDDNFLFPAGLSFGFFIVPDASSPTHRISQDGFGNGPTPVGDPVGPAADVTEILFSVPALQKPSLQNAGIAQHSVQYIPPPDLFSEIFGDVLIFSFEDIRRDDERSNEDFEDVVFMVEIDLEDTDLLSEAPSLAPTSPPTIFGNPAGGPTAPSSAPSKAPTVCKKSKKSKKNSKKNKKSKRKGKFWKRRVLSDEHEDF